ncbi:hypothetical protein [Candidatus Methanomethylophilus sp. 1R26]|uniref:hypothetical protein n=1 Tax=Candidatus Methanomethylophilus sp. 1R26 TaxID=1769296 RepID=UPI0009E6AC1C|nr:hypothetical protein [Candidatus Methanomethylophilus sp. 1R26]
MSDLFGRAVIVAFTIVLVVCAAVSFFVSRNILEDFGLIVLLLTVLSIIAGIAAISYLLIMRNKMYDPLDPILESNTEKKRIRPSLWSRTS